MKPTSTFYAMMLCITVTSALPVTPSWATALSHTVKRYMGPCTQVNCEQKCGDSPICLDSCYNEPQYAACAGSGSQAGEMQPVRINEDVKRAIGPCTKKNCEEHCGYAAICLAICYNDPKHGACAASSFQAGEMQPVRWEELEG